MSCSRGRLKHLPDGPQHIVRVDIDRDLDLEVDR